MPSSFVGFYSLTHLRWTFQLAATYAFRAMVDYNTPAVKNELVKLLYSVLARKFGKARFYTAFSLWSFAPLPHGSYHCA
jgi:hypothetical protein